MSKSERQKMSFYMDFKEFSHTLACKLSNVKNEEAIDDRNSANQKSS